jgi:DNA gyrase subunit A
VQKIFDFTDGEHVVGVVSMDERALPGPVREVQDQQALFDEDGQVIETGPFIVAATSEGMCLRVAAEHFSEPSTRNGRQFMKVPRGEAVISASVAAGDENVCMATRSGNVLIFPVRQIPVVKSAAKGVIGIRLNKDDRLLGCALSSAARQGLEVETSRGRREVVRTTKFEVSNRGNKGRTIIKRGNIASVVEGVTEIRLTGKNGESRNGGHSADSGDDDDES